MSARHRVALLCLVAVVVGLVRVSRTRRRRITDLLVSARRLADGDLSAQVSISHGMNSRLSELGQELEQVREAMRTLAEAVRVSRDPAEMQASVAPECARDHLTGLVNRRRFDEALAEEVNRANRFDTDLALLSIDLDDFKAVNVTYGFQQGDAVLRQVARVVRNSTREIDCAARLGGDMLAVVLPGIDLETACNLAERIRDEIQQLRIPCAHGAGEVRVTMSCGVASRGTPAAPSALLQAADEAMIEAKRRGKNKSVRAE